MKLYLPGLREYAHCKAQFELAEKLLEKPDENKKELSGILQTLDNNPDAVDFLKAEFKGRYRQVYEKLTTISVLAQQATTRGDYLKLENIVCIDADGREFERYPKVYINLDVEKSDDGKIAMFTPYKAIHHLEQRGDFVPSVALLANIHVALYHAAVEKQADGSYRTKDAKLETALQKFKDRGDGIGGQWANTLVNWSAQQVIHYPYDRDFTSDGGTSKVNASHKRIALWFDNTGFSNTAIKNALALPNYRRYLQNYSGLADPAVLIELALYYGKTARSWVNSGPETRAAWLGCGNEDYFDLYAYNGLNYANAARGVSLVAPAGPRAVKRRRYEK